MGREIHLMPIPAVDGREYEQIIPPECLANIPY